MGCDIHLYHEKKVDGVWVPADNWEPNEYFPVEGGCPVKVDWKNRLYDGRNYRLFAVLANVRNGFGFAGIKTGDPVIPIAMPRGIPEDSCQYIKDTVKDWGVDGHSHSWLNLADLQAYPWKSARKTGVIDLDVYVEWKRSGEKEPETWAGDVSGPQVSIVSEAEAGNLIETHGIQQTLAMKKGNVYVRAEWSNSLRDDCAEFLKIVEPRLQELESEFGVGNARIVFFFDN